MKLKFRRPKKSKKLVTREKPQEVEDESLVLQYMIMHDEVVEDVWRYYDSEVFTTADISQPYRKIFSKVFEYFEKYNKAPKRAIAHIIKKEIKADEDITEDLLEGIANEYEANRRGYKVDPKYITGEVVPRFIRSIKVNNTLQQIETNLLRKNYIKAENIISNYTVVTQDTPDPRFGFVAPFNLEYQEDFLRRQKEDGGNICFSFDKTSGDIRYLVGNLKYGWLVSLLGTTKSGKSYLAWEIARQAALRLNKKVLLFCPEMTEQDMQAERIQPWLLERPAQRYRRSNYDYIPTMDCQKNQFNTCRYLNDYGKPSNPNDYALFSNFDEGGKIEPIYANSRQSRQWEPCEICRFVKQSKHFEPAVFWKRERLKRSIETYKNLYKMTKENLIIYADGREDNLQIKYFPKYGVSLEECIQDARLYKKHFDFDYDIVIFDYLDILRLPGNSNEQKWQRIDALWRTASAFAQEDNCLVISPEQSTGEGRYKRLLDHTVTNEAKAKDNHLDKKIGVIKFDDETNNNICRVNVIYDRHSPFDRKVEVVVLQDLTSAQAITDSVFWHNLDCPPWPIKIPEET